MAIGIQVCPGMHVRAAPIPGLIARDKLAPVEPKPQQSVPILHGPNMSCATPKVKCTGNGDKMARRIPQSRHCRPTRRCY
ncbi:MAG: hypothetical protein IT552_11165 [Sphingomonadaceae bacterium]|nr:hypothetical protein [Sphingomonadaceae bacterium]